VSELGFRRRSPRRLGPGTPVPDLSHPSVASRVLSAPSPRRSRSRSVPVSWPRGATLLSLEARWRSLR